MKLPLQSKQVFKGKIFDVYQWEQEMFDGSTETFERLKRVNSIRVLATKNNKIILCKEQQPGTSTDACYCFFGGRQDEGESPEECAVRELKEEAGMEATSLELYSTVEPYDKMDFTVYTFIARQCNTVSEPHLDPGEKITPVEVSFDEFLDIAASDIFMEKQFAYELMRMRLLYPEKLEMFRKKLFE